MVNWAVGEYARSHGRLSRLKPEELLQNLKSQPLISFVVMPPHGTIQLQSLFRPRLVLPSVSVKKYLLHTGWLEQSVARNSSALATDRVNACMYLDAAETWEAPSDSASLASSFGPSLSLSLSRSFSVFSSHLVPLRLGRASPSLSPWLRSSARFLPVLLPFSALPLLPLRPLSLSLSISLSLSPPPSAHIFARTYLHI